MPKSWFTRISAVERTWRWLNTLTKCIPVHNAGEPSRAPACLSKQKRDERLMRADGRSRCDALARKTKRALAAKANSGSLHADAVQISMCTYLAWDRFEWRHLKCSFQAAFGGPPYFLFLSS